jgi:hypothetical protein
MITIILHLILPITFYSTITEILYRGLNLGPLEATGISAFFVSLVLYYFYKRDQKVRGKTTKSFCSVKGCLVSILLFGGACCILGNYAVVVSGLNELSSNYKRVASALYSPPFLIQILAAGLVIPIVEELIFRGMVFASIRDRLSFWPSAVVSALFFGLFHGNLVQGVYAFLIGIALAWIYEVCKTLLAPYLFHVSANIVSLCITNSVFGDILLPGKVNVVMIFMTVACLAVAILCAIQIYLKNNAKEDIV